MLRMLRLCTTEPWLASGCVLALFTSSALRQAPSSAMVKQMDVANRALCFALRNPLSAWRRGSSATSRSLSRRPMAVGQASGPFLKPQAPSVKGKNKLVDPWVKEDDQGRRRQDLVDLQSGAAPRPWRRLAENPHCVAEGLEGEGDSQGRAEALGIEGRHAPSEAE